MQINNRIFLEPKSADTSGNTSISNKSIRDIFQPNNFTESDGQIPEYPILVNGCNCQRKCVEKFDKEDIVMSHLNCCELNYYCGNHLSFEPVCSR